MLRDFQEFLLKQNALALAIGVIIGAAVGRVVASLVADVLMPVISLGLPGGEWRTAKFVLSETAGPDGVPVVNAINYGAFLGILLDFAIVVLVVFLILRALVRPPPSEPTKGCPFCREKIPLDATRCRACTSTLA